MLCLLITKWDSPNGYSACALPKSDTYSSSHEGALNDMHNDPRSVQSWVDADSDSRWLAHEIDVHFIISTGFMNETCRCIRIDPTVAMRLLERRTTPVVAGKKASCWNWTIPLTGLFDSNLFGLALQRPVTCVYIYTGQRSRTIKQYCRTHILPKEMGSRASCTAGTCHRLHILSSMFTVM